MSLLLKSPESSAIHDAKLYGFYSAFSLTNNFAKVEARP
jgi:hypothetical protein